LKKLLLLFIFIPVFLVGQQTKKMVDKETNETYFVLKSDKTIKHGEYNKFSYKKTRLIKGSYKQGLKDSIWECYDFDGHTILKVDYSKNELLYFNPKDKFRKYKIINSALGADTILSRNPIYLGGDDTFTSDIVVNLRYPTVAIQNGVSGKVYVSFVVDKAGKTDNFEVKHPLGFGLDQEAMRVLKLQTFNWLPGIQNGKSVDVEVVCPIQFRLQ